MRLVTLIETGVRGSAQYSGGQAWTGQYRSSARFSANQNSNTSHDSRFDSKNRISNIDNAVYNTQRDPRYTGEVNVAAAIRAEGTAPGLWKKNMKKSLG
jgi:hypothetical protein